MKQKKTKKANLENLRTIFFQIGMILTLSAILVAFEWNSAVEIEPLIYQSFDGFEEIVIPKTKPKEEKIVKPPVPIEKLIIESNETIIEDPLMLIDDGIDLGDPIKIIDFGEPEEKFNEEFVKVEIMPTFQGKDGVYFRNYVASNVIFPPSAVEGGVKGTVFASFVIDENGDLVDAIITRKVHPVIDKAVLKVIEGSPKWEPGIQEGRAVRVRYSIAIAFKLQ